MSISTETIRQARQTALPRQRVAAGGGALLPLEQLRQHFQRLATQHVAGRPGRDALRRRLTAASDGFQALHRRAARAAERNETVAPATLTLLESLGFIEEHLDLAQQELSRVRRLPLPSLCAGAATGLPRIFDVAQELLSRSDRPLDAELIDEAVAAYQSRTALMLRELWALPAMLRLVYLEHLGRVAARLAALDSAGQPGAPAQQGGGSAEISPRREAAAIKNCIVGLRSLASFDWREFVERQSAVEANLRRDPLDIYSQMEPKGRDRYRKVVEKLACRSPLAESQVAQAAIELAGVSHGRNDLGPRPNAGNRRGSFFSEGMKERHVGFFLVDRGRRALEERIGYAPTWRERLARAVASAPLTGYFGTIALLWFALVTGVFLWGINALLPLAGLPAFLLAMICFAGVAAECAVRAVNCLATMLVQPRPIMRLDFSRGIPDDCRTLVAVPTMLTFSSAIRQLAANLEVRYLANRNDNLCFALVTDFADADAETLPGDAELLELAGDEIRQLNARYGEGGIGPFFLLHRPRKWNAQEGKWMGEERKRGKLGALNRLLRGDGAEFSVTAGDLDFLQSVRYVITLDTDTQLPPGTAREMIEAMAHPLNRPRIDRITRMVVEGHAILQPRVGTTIPAARRSAFAQLFAGDAGVDPYTQQTSDVYQDLFDEGSFIGKGIYDVDAFRTVFEGRFPDNRVLSHDLIEGCFARSGLINDVELFEGFPARLPADMGRRHRWIRGDWQIAAWLGRRVPGDCPDFCGVPAERVGKNGTVPFNAARNPLSPLSRWKIFDNLRRSLSPVFLLGFLLTAWLLVPQVAGGCLLLAIVVSLAPDLLALLPGCVRRPPGKPWRLHFRHRAADLGKLLCREAIGWAMLPYTAVANLDAIARALYRLNVSHRKLLEWTVSSEAERTCVTAPRGYCRLFWPCPLAAALAAIWLSAACPATLLAVGPLLIAWLAAPLVAWRISRPRSLDSVPLAAAHERNVRRWARRTWHFFDTFVNDETHWLPPDNVQWDATVPQAFQPDGTGASQPGKTDVHGGTVAPRTSPTNIGLGLLADLAAHDLGYLSATRLIERTGRTLQTMLTLECHRGHFYNWYDTRTLKPAGPRYVSTVDSGNLCGALLAMSAGLAELPTRPLVGPRFARGFQDTLDVLAEIDAPIAAARAIVARSVSEAYSIGHRSGGCLRASEAMELVASMMALAAKLESAPRSARAQEWTATLRRQCEAARAEVTRFAFWLGDNCDMSHAAEPSACVPDAGRPSRLVQHRTDGLGSSSCQSLASNLLAAIDRADRECTLRRLPDAAAEIGRLAGELAAMLQTAMAGQRSHARLSHPAPFGEEVPTLLAELAALQRRAEQAAAAAREQLAEIDSLSKLCRDLAVMDFGFLYNSQRKLLAVGYNVGEKRRDASCYDLLASEARLTSFLAVSDGQLPAEHWAALGRGVALHGGEPALMSWSGSMFEYLMPMLVMPSHATTLLEASCRAAIRRQMDYALQHGLPWGISESCYDLRNDDGDYSYRAFGVPGLRLERRTDRSLVIAPYASALATMIAPAVACDNLSRLENMDALCPYGFYDAVDFTPADAVRRPAACRTVMAHHSGMALVAFANVLLDAPMRRRLMADPRLQAYELLLQQRMPQTVRPVDWRKREEIVRLLARLEGIDSAIADRERRGGSECEHK